MPDLITSPLPSRDVNKSRTREICGDISGRKNGIARVEFRGPRGIESTRAIGSMFHGETQERVREGWKERDGERNEKRNRILWRGCRHNVAHNSP